MQHEMCSVRFGGLTAVEVMRAITCPTYFGRSDDMLVARPIRVDNNEDSTTGPGDEATVGDSSQRECEVVDMGRFCLLGRIRKVGRR